MLTDLDCCNLLQQQYDGKPDVFDYVSRIGEVSVALKHYPDCDLIAFEGSHNIPDWYSNFKAWMIPVDGIGKVEQGFFDDMPATVEALRQQLQADKPKVITGHSRGAAHTNIYARLLIQNGENPRLLRRVRFGEPRSGNADYVAGFAGSPGVTYRNYGNLLDQDWVCDVPLHFLLEAYEIIEPPTLINVAPVQDDKWLFLARHHLFLYNAGVSRVITGK